jgi:hypothetical protein
MKKLTIILSLFMAVSFSYSQNDETMKQLISVVNDIQVITQKDDGKFWNIQYAAPLLFVNPESRQTFVFDMDKEPYEIVLDETVPIGNTGSNWNGKLWAMSQLPLPEQPFFSDNLILHEMFHALQPQLGFDSLYEVPCAHLEKEEARISLRLEMQALLKALEQIQNKDSMYKHLTNAISFRNSRYAIFPDAKEKENMLELNEGMAEYTTLMMIQRNSPNKLNDKELMRYFNSRISRLEQNSFVRSFAYETIPLYGYLIQTDIPYWHQKVTKKTNLTDYFMQIMNIDNGNDEWKTLGLQYNYANIALEERMQAEQTNADMNAVKEKFFCVNHVEIPLFNYSYNFNPLGIRIIDGVGEFHEDIRIMDDWGKVEVSNGLIFDKENRKVILTPITKTKNNVIFGNGWELHLNDGWEITEQGDFMEVKEK